VIFRAFLSILAGLAHAASMGSPWDGRPVWWLQLLAMGVLVWQLEAIAQSTANMAPAARRKSAAMSGWLFTTSWLCGTFWWLFVAMHTYGGLAAPLTVLAIFALAAVLALYYAGICALFMALVHVHRAFSAIIFGAMWMLAEMARGTWFTGFGWGAAGYAHLDGLGVLARYIGAYGVGAVAVMVAYSVASNLRAALTAQRKRARIQAAVIALGLPVLISLTAGGTLPVRMDIETTSKPLDVALLQGNIAQDEKFQPGTGIADSLRWYGQQVAMSTAALVVAPETAIPILPHQLPGGYWDALAQKFTQPEGNQALLIGIPLGSAAQGYTNSVIGLKPLIAPSPTPAQDGPTYRYDKHHLVPFGEFIPPLFKWFTEMMNIPLGDFNRGAVGQPSFEWHGQRLAPHICYEDLFGEELAARFQDGPTAPTIFVNVSNIGWFGNTVAIDQHLSIARMRALEFERPFIRATNTGATVVIDHTGEVTHALRRHTRGVLLAQVQGRSGTQANGWGITPFAWWASRFGLWPLWLFGVAVVALATWRARRSA
jgi:apolipoprotein N-acyltransferase